MDIEKNSMWTAHIKNGLYHRLDGPAIIWWDGYLEWWINGIKYKDKEEWFNALTAEQKVYMIYSEDFIGVIK
jgi:hypothetical protein